MKERFANFGINFCANVIERKAFQTIFFSHMGYFPEFQWKRGFLSESIGSGILLILEI